MNKQALEGQIGYLRMVLGITRRVVDQFPEDKMDFRVGPGARSVAELVSHLAGQFPDTMKSVVAGRTEFSDDVKLGSKKDALAYLDSSVAAFYRDWPSVTDAQLGREIEAWGQTFPGWKLVTFLYDEQWHHRGQLTAYLRALGIEPIMIYDYEGN